MTTTTAEYTIPPQYKTDRRSPVRWVTSHALHEWWILLIALVGALGNAGLMAVASVQIGNAFNVVAAEVFDPRALLRIFWMFLSCNLLFSTRYK